MTLRFATRFAVGFMLLTVSVGGNSAHGQTSVGWGQHVTPYGTGYVGNVPNTIPATSYYRAPQFAAPVTAGYAPTTSYYAPPAAYPAYAQPAPNYSPAVSYKVGTPNAAAYTGAYSPIVTPSAPYNANWQYPPQTVFPTAAQPVVANYAPAGYAAAPTGYAAQTSYAGPASYATTAGYASAMPYSAGYAPVPPYYTTNYARTPVTTFRPVSVYGPSGTQTVLQPCTGYECQARRAPGCGFCQWLFHHHQRPVTPVVPVIPQAAPPVILQPTVSNYACPTSCASSCGSGACSRTVAPLAQPYYTPGPTTIGPATNSGIGVPANSIPSLNSPSFTTPSLGPVGSSPTTIGPPGYSGGAPGFSNGTSIGSGLPTNPGFPVNPGIPANGVPANQIPLLNPSQFNSSGSQRADFAPANDPYAPAAAPRVQYVPVQPAAPARVFAPAMPAAPITPIPADANGDGVADEVPSLLGPSNAPASSEPPPTYPAPPEDGVQLNARPNLELENKNSFGIPYAPVQPAPRAMIRRDAVVTPIPDPEYPTRRPITEGAATTSDAARNLMVPGNRSNTQKAPQLINPRDRTASSVEANRADAQLASFEREIKPVARPQIAPVNQRPQILGDEVWHSAK